MRGHAPAAVDLARVDRAGMVRRRIVPHLVERPGEVDCGRPRGTEDGVGRSQIVPVYRGECEPVRRRHPDRGSATDDHRPDRLGDLGGGPAAHLDDLVRQPALVEQDDGVLLEARDLFRFEHRRDASRSGALVP